MSNCIGYIVSEVIITATAGGCNPEMLKRNKKCRKRSGVPVLV
jgi:hypothetical protein